MRLALLAWLALAVGACDGTDTVTSATSALPEVSLAKSRVVPTRYASLAVASQSVCAVALTGRAYCWGLNNYAQLGSGAIGGFSPTPHLVAGGHLFTKIAANYTHACALEQDQTAWCWGPHDNGQLGTASPAIAPAPVLAASGALFTDIDVGAWHTCAIRSDATGALDGLAFCWGNNALGQLGNAATGPLFNPTPVQVLNVIPVLPPSGPFPPLRMSQLDLGSWASCGLSEDYDHVTYQVVPRAELWKCWGSNYTGLFGDGTVAQFPNVPTAAWTTLSSSSIWGLDFLSEHVCVVASRKSNVQAGGTYCSGLNTDGQLGDGTQVTRVDPTPVVGGSGFVAVSAGTNHSCALDRNGSAYCWGSNDEGQLGSGDLTPSLTPRAVTSAVRFDRIFASNRFTCALTKQGDAYCWGRNEVGELGDGTVVQRTTPVAVIEP